jgi:hypothetical protein
MAKEFKLAFWISVASRRKSNEFRQQAMHALPAVRVTSFANGF